MLNVQLGIYHNDQICELYAFSYFFATLYKNNNLGKIGFDLFVVQIRNHYLSYYYMY